MFNTISGTRYTFARNEAIRKGSGFQETIQLKPQKVSVKLRVDEPYNISLNYKQATDYPIDLYYLMDLSKSMEDDKVRQ